MEKKLKVCGYCRVSTETELQESSIKMQVEYYSSYIKNNPNYKYCGVFADVGVTGTSTEKRTEFNKMIEKALNGEIDKILTKSISRFGRNTVDVLKNIRLLQEKGIGVYFEKENIDTLEPSGELLLTIISSIAQEESRSISENIKWGMRKRFEQGKSMRISQIYGFTSRKNGKLEVNKKEAKVVKFIYEEFLKGQTVRKIATELEKRKIKASNNKDTWNINNIIRILTSEKYKGDTILQKTYVVDYLTKERHINNGELPQYYVTDSHEAIVSKNTWKCAQIEMGERRKNDIDKKYSHKIFCGNCGGEYKCSYRSLSQIHSEFWRCNNSLACDDYKLRTTTVDEVFIKLYNQIIAEKDKYIEKWKSKLTERNIYNRYKTELFLEHLKVAKPIETYDDNVFLLFVKRIEVLDKFKFRVVLTNNSKIIIEL